MPFTMPIDSARKQFPEYEFIGALTPSAQKAAFHVRDNHKRDLCLKIFGPGCDQERINREILALQAIAHANVARLIEYTFSTKDGSQRHFMVEEFVAGCDLTARLSGTPWDPLVASDFFAQLCDGLTELRKAQIVHRDLKPNNIRVRNDGTPVIIDFGVARHLGRADLTSTAGGAQIGTPTYFAPEQFVGNKHDIDHRTDLFALGVLLYQALVGEHPFFHTGMSFESLKDAVCSSDAHLGHARFKSLPKELRILIQKLLSKQRANRPQSADQAAAILRKARGGTNATGSVASVR